MVARIRWSNVGVAVAAVALLAVVVAWPLLEPAAPELPEGPPRVVVATPSPVAEPPSFERRGGGAERVRPAKPVRTAAGKGREGAKRRGSGAKRARPAEASAAVPVVPPPPIVAAPPVAAVAPAPVESRDFGGFER